jgi:predicted nucleic acid-binding protein
MNEATQAPVSVESYPFKKDDCLFLDANIWMFVYGPKQPKDKTDIYSDALDRILKAGSSIFIDFLVLSEVINAYSRIRWKLVCPSCTFKVFRNGPQFIPTAEEIADYVRRIIRMCSRIESGYEIIDVEALMDEYQGGGFDYNDQVFRELCKNKGWTLVTDDGDFDAQEISVLTANERLLRSGRSV